jgi:hypothetical protein
MKQRISITIGRRRESFSRMKTGLVPLDEKLRKFMKPNK